MAWTQDSVGLVSNSEDVSIGGTLDVTGTITGNVTGNVTGSSGSCTGNAATVSTISGLAPDTAPTGAFLLPVSAAAQTNITSVGTLTALTVDAGSGLQVKNESETDNGTGRIQINSKANQKTNLSLIFFLEIHNKVKKL